MSYAINLKVEHTNKLAQENEVLREQMREATQLLESIYCVLQLEQAQSRHPLNRYTLEVLKFLEGVTK